MEWGNKIAVNGVRPDWLRDDETVWPSENSRKWSSPFRVSVILGWEASISSVRLPADHPYYTVQRYNEQHGTSFVYWPGGDAAPADFDGTMVLNGEGETYDGFHGYDWSYRGPTKIIGYTRRSEPRRDTVAVERRTAGEWVALIGASLAPGEAQGVLRALLYLQVVKPEPTEAERIAAETGVPVETVQRVLDARS